MEKMGRIQEILEAGGGGGQHINDDSSEEEEEETSGDYSNGTMSRAEKERKIYGRIKSSSSVRLFKHEKYLFELLF
jgi:hypothetical protein